MTSHTISGDHSIKEQSRHVLRNKASRCLRRTTMVRNYVRRDVDTVSESQIKVPELESKLVVHSSIIVGVRTMIQTLIYFLCILAGVTCKFVELNG